MRVLEDRADEVSGNWKDEKELAIKNGGKKASGKENSLYKWTSLMWNIAGHL